MPQLLAHINLGHGAIGRCNLWAKEGHALMSILFYHYYFLRKNNPHPNATTFALSHSHHYQSHMVESLMCFRTFPLKHVSDS